MNSHSTTWMIDLRKVKCQTSMIRSINDVKYEETLMHLANGPIEEVKMICHVSLIRTITTILYLRILNTRKMDTH